MPSISDPIISIKGLGKKTSDRLNQLGIHTLEHLVFHLPNRYQDKTSITPLSDAGIHDEILIEATIDRIEVIPSRQRQLLCYLSDNQNHRILLRFFHFNQYQKQALIRGDIMQCFGEIKIGRKGLEMHHPEYRIITQNQSPLLEPTLTPIYPLCSGISQNKMKQWVNYSLEVLKISQLDDYFEKITDEDCKYLGLSELWCRPEWLICSCLPVPPPSLRPSVKQDNSQRMDDDLTHKLQDIIKTNNLLSTKIKNNTNIVRVISDINNYVLYFSRSNIPFEFKKNVNFFNKHLSIISFTPFALKKFALHKQTPLELIEDIELLRALEIGLKIKTLKLKGDSFSVDVEEDYFKAKKKMTKDKFFKFYKVFN